MSKRKTTRAIVPEPQPVPPVNQPDLLSLGFDPETDPLLLNYVHEDEQRQQIWQEANDNLREVIAGIATWFIHSYRADILRRYQLAELIKKVHDDHMNNREHRYGSYAMEKLKKFFGWEVNTLYQALRLAKAYTREDIEAISKLRLRDGRPISYYHVELLANIDDSQDREAILAKTLEESWSGQDLAFHIHQLPGRKSKGDGRGRPLATPRNLDDVIKQQTRSADDFLNRSTQVWDQTEHGLLAKVYDCACDDLTPERVEQLKDHAQKLRRLAEEAQKRAAEAEKAYQEALSLLERRLPSVPIPVHPV